MMEGLVVRKANQADIVVMTQLLGILFVLETDFEVDAMRQATGLACMLASPVSRFVLVAEVNGEVVGMVTMQILISTAVGGHVGLIEDLVVKEDYRGQGIGSRLLGDLEQLAIENGLLRLQLLTDRKNLAAQDFYAKLGWEETELVAKRRQPSRR